MGGWYHESIRWDYIRHASRVRNHSNDSGVCCIMSRGEQALAAFVITMVVLGIAFKVNAVLSTI